MQVWEICVPTESVNEAKELLQSEPYSAIYCLAPWPKRDSPIVRTYTRFKTRDVKHYFVLVPSLNVHIDCRSSNIVRSVRELPYPSLPVFIQSCLDRWNMLELVDVVDGTDLPEQWGEEHLQPEGTNDVAWGRDMIVEAEKLRGVELQTGFFGVPIMPRSRRDMWQEAVRTKEKRLDWTKPKNVFVTQYRLVDAPDSWTVLSDMY